MAYQRILDERTYVEIAEGLNCSLNFLYRQFGAQKERARREPVRSPFRLPPAEREEISRQLQEAASFWTLAARLGRSPSTISREANAHGGRAK